MLQNELSVVDVAVVGAGFGGLYAIYRMREMGLSVQGFDAADDVGGTWYWNRYPGARCDIESVDYSFSFSPELEQEWVWTERYATQPEILSYLNHVADRFGLRDHIAFNTRVTQAAFDADSARWMITTQAGDRCSARFCLMAPGVLSSLKHVDFPGQGRFAGQVFHTARWPRDGVNLSGKRVGIIGTGSTGVQAIPLLAEVAHHLTVFQRTPNFSVPARNRPLDAAALEAVKATYPDRRESSRHSLAGMPAASSPGSALDHTPEERTAIYEAAWQAGGGPPLLRAFNDIATDLEANATAADFVRAKISEIVSDPETAARLTPTDHPLGTKRICVDTDYYATYNRDDVELVDVRADPIVEFFEGGVRTASDEYHLDVVVLAVGFDAVTGALLDMDIRGRDGQALSDVWADGPRTLLGVAVAGFPNLFTITGPQSPSVLGNVVTSIEQHVEFIAACLEHLRAIGEDTVEATAEAQNAWVEHVTEVASASLLSKTRSWYSGANIPGKPRVVLPYVGGVGTFREICDGVAARDFDGFAFSTAGRPLAAGERHA